MELLLTSESIHNKTIESAFRELLDKPSRECTLVYITTSQNGAVGDKSWFIRNLNDVYDMGWKSFEIIDLAAMIDLPKSMWWGRIEAADVIFMGGGTNFYLGYWLEKSGLAAALPNLLQNKVYVGSSAGGMVVAQSIVTASQSLKQLATGQPLNNGYFRPQSPTLSPCIGLSKYSNTSALYIANVSLCNRRTIAKSSKHDKLLALCTR